MGRRGRGRLRGLRVVRRSELGGLGGCLVDNCIWV